MQINGWAAGAVVGLAFALTGCGASGGGSDGAASSTTKLVATTTTAPVTTTSKATSTTTALPTTTTNPPPPPTTEPPVTTPPAPPTTAVAQLAYGSPCTLGSHPDCIDPDGDGQGTYLRDGAQCMANMAPQLGASICTDLDGDGTAGYPDAG